MRKLTPDEMGRTIPAPDVRHPVRVVVDDVRSAFNVGSILRTADALGLEHVYLAGFTADGHHPGVHKAALGAQDTVPWSSVPTAEEALVDARGAGCVIAALEITDSSTPVSSLTEAHFPLCLVVGNELEGVSERVLSLCDLAIELPQHGAKHSLNVAVAFGVAGYDVVRRYRALVAEIG